MPERIRVVLLGATGSIGESTLRVIAAHPDRLELVGLAARANAAKLAATAARFGVRHVALHDEGAAAAARRDGVFGPGTHLGAGLAGLEELAVLPEADVVLVAVVGTTALRPTLAAIGAGKTIALASKEILVLAGRFVMEAARRADVPVRPVDSEHCALFQCLEAGRQGVRRVYLTASGGAFRDRAPEELADVTPADALRHPNWSMGPKITVDSATLANKGLEMIEAQWLFDLRPDQIDAVLHPQSVVHGLVEYLDGSVLAQLSPPSMTFAIQHALLHTGRAAGVDAPLDFSRRLQLDFRPVEPGRYPCFALARRAMEAGGAAPAVFNAANEVAVEAFLRHQLPFLAIPRVIEHCLAAVPAGDPATLDAVLATEAEARRVAAAALATVAHR